jgi:photosystem II stability/assembly factor-like uncharacterized protein
VKSASLVFCACTIGFTLAAAARPTIGRRMTPHVVAAEDSAGQWVSIGPDFIRNVTGTTFNTGRVASIAVDPSNASHWLSGVGNGGVWETRDAGATWGPIADDAPTLAIGAVAFAPSDPNVIYAGTGESEGGAGFAHTGMGILKSIDAGRNWTLLAFTTFNRAAIKRIQVHPTNPDIVMAITSRAGFGRDAQEGAPSPPPFGVWKSIDGGNAWVLKLGGQMTALEVDPSNFNNQYAAIGDQRLGLFSDPGSPSINGIYRSADAGETWSLLDGPWGNVDSRTRSNVGLIALAIAPSNPSTVYASIEVGPTNGAANGSLLGLYRTDNAWGGTPAWIQIPTDATGPGGYCGPSKCGYSHVITIDPGDPNRLFAGTAQQGFWRCSNCTTSPTWIWVDRGAGVQPDFHATTWIGNRLIVGNDGGVWSTRDFGATWQNHNNRIPTVMFYSGALHPTDAGFILGGLRDFPPAVQRNGSSIWQSGPVVAGNGVEWGEAEVALSTSHPNTDWMVADTHGVILRTIDGGQSGIVANVGIDTACGGILPQPGTCVAFVAPVRKCPSDDNVFLTGTNRIWRTNDFFNSTTPDWASNSPPGPVAVPNVNGLTVPGVVLSITYAPTDMKCDTYAYGNRGGQVQLTQNGGASWTDLDPGRTLPLRPINGLAFDPANANVIYAVVSSFDDGTPGRPGHVFKTMNALSTNASWTNISPPSNAPFNVVAVDPKNAQRVYAGSDVGLWHSNDGGSTWVKDGLDVGLPNVTVHDIQINPTTNKTVIFTYGRGAYVLTTPP